MGRVLSDKYKKRGYTKVRQDLESTISFRIVKAIMHFKDTKLFQWVRNHQNGALAFVLIWGIIIFIIFFWFIVAHL